MAILAYRNIVSVEVNSNSKTHMLKNHGILSVSFKSFREIAGGGGGNTHDLPMTK